MSVVDSTAESDLDTIFAEVGEFGIYQIAIYLLICIPNALSATFVMNYMFTANTLDYRCKISECDASIDNREIEFDRPWLTHAIPSTNHSFANCVRYAPKVNVTKMNQYECSADMFDSTKQIECNEFVYASDEINLQTDFNIHCKDSYKLALVGTVSSVGRFLFLPLTGFLADKFGRLRVVITGMFCASLFGLIKSISISYFMYITFEFFEAAAGTSVFGGMYILGIEWVSSKYRVLGSTIMAISFPVGEILLGFAAMYIHNYRYLLRTLYIPGIFIVFYYWLLPESVRWLLVHGHVDRAITILKRTATVNGKTLSDKTIEVIRLRYSRNTNAKKCTSPPKKVMNESGGSPSILHSLQSIMKSQKLCIRFVISCLIWMTCCYCYYGLSLISTNIPGENRYISFMIAGCVEIPGCLLTAPLLNRFARRKVLSGTLMITGLCTFVTPFISGGYSSISLIFFMLGKASITCAFTTVYTFTAEMWPTCVRTTVMNSCSMVARIGSMVAPLTPLLASHFTALPFFLFGSTAVLAGVLVFFLCETFGKNLPDTIDDAKNL